MNCLKITKHYKIVGYSINTMQQCAHLIVSDNNYHLLMKTAVFSYIHDKRDEFNLEIAIF